MRATGERQNDDVAISWCLLLNEGSLHQYEQDNLRAWLGLDATHRERMDTAINLWEGIEQDAYAPEMLVLRRQALAAVQRAGEQRWSTARPTQWLRFAVAAIVLLAVGLTFVSVSGVSHDPAVRYVTGVGDQRTVSLDDGSTMVLDSDSAVAVNFTSERRDLALERGRATFKVAKNPLRPFAVTSGHHMVVATGTSFSVERLANEMRVVLYEGHVAVLRDSPGGHAVQFTRTGGISQAAEQALTPGKELIVTDGQPLGVLRVAAVNDTLGGGQLSFTNEPLAIAVERVNRYSVDKRIEFAAQASGIRVSGVFNAGDADAFARGVAAAFPVHVTLRGSTIVLTPRDIPAHTNSSPDAVQNEK